jgi:hypothetical protein
MVLVWRQPFIPSRTTLSRYLPLRAFLPEAGETHEPGRISPVRSATAPHASAMSAAKGAAAPDKVAPDLVLDCAVCSGGMGSHPVTSETSETISGHG